jgi:hypothetical protein
VLSAPLNALNAGKGGDFLLGTPSKIHLLGSEIH